MLVNEDKISDLIPQQPPFIMVGRLIECNHLHTLTSTLITAANVLVENNKFSEAGLVENIAQTAAAGAGYVAKHQNKPVAKGYIGAINNLEIFKLPNVGDVLETEVKIVEEIFNITLIKGSISCNGLLLTVCEMKIFT